eukprot:352249-Chlamydomonas_euryale.AAC.12
MAWASAGPCGWHPAAKRRSQNLKLMDCLTAGVRLLLGARLPAYLWPSGASVGLRLPAYTCQSFSTAGMRVSGQEASAWSSPTCATSQPVGTSLGGQHAAGTCRIVTAAVCSQRLCEEAPQPSHFHKRWHCVSTRNLGLILVV